MLKRTIKYTDYNGEPQEEIMYFHLSKAELLELELSEVGGFSEMLKKTAEAQNPKEVLAAFKEIVSKAYGIKSPDGKQFMKSEEIRQQFLHSAAYDELFVELATNADAAAAFFNGVIPSDMTPGLEMEMKRIANPQLPPPPAAV
jgi:predicted nucleic acid-binding protein